MHEVFIEHPVDREYLVERSISAKILRCSACRSLFQQPWPSSAETGSFYPTDYQNYVKSSVPMIGELFLTLQRLTARSFVARHGREVRVLDFGCGPGFFLDSLAQQGVSRLTGFDYETQGADDMRSFEFVSAFETLARYGPVFDVIRLNHVIEHLADVDGTMRLLASLLAPGGVLIGQTPRADHYTGRLFRGYWGPLHFPFHTVLFSRNGLRDAAPRWGLTLKRVSRAVLPTGWAMSFENYTKPWIDPGRRGRSRVYPVWLVAGVPFATLDWLCGATAMMNFELQHRQS